MLEQQRGVLEAQVRAQRVNAAVGGGAVGAQAALRRVRVEVVPAVGDLLAARLAAPQRRALGGRHEHAVVRVLRRRGQVRALCNNARPQPAANAAAPLACSGAVQITHIRRAFCLRVARPPYRQRRPLRESNPVVGQRRRRRRWRSGGSDTTHRLTSDRAFDALRTLRVGWE